jgi:hypothetical protein
MSIDKESTGLPTVNVHRQTTKINLWMVAAILFFFAIMTAIAVWVSRESRTPAASPPANIEVNPASKN